MGNAGAILRSETGPAERLDIEMAVEESAVVRKVDEEGLGRPVAQAIVNGRPRGW